MTKARQSSITLRVGIFAVAIGLAAWLLGAPAMAQAQTTPPGIQVSAVAGFDGYVRAGAWLPITVTLENSGPDVDVRVEAAMPLSFGEPQAYSSRVSMPNQSRKLVTLYVPMRNYSTYVNVVVYEGSRLLAETRANIQQIEATDLMYGVLAGSPSAFYPLRSMAPLTGSAYLAELTVEQLPPITTAWRTLDVLVVSNVDTGQLSAAQVQALTGWVLQGGRLVVATGPDWQKTISGLSALLPATVSGTDTLTNADAITAAYAGSAVEGDLPIAVLQPAADSEVMLVDGNQPLIVSKNMGYGRVTMLAFDPALAPLNGYAEIDRLYQPLLSMVNDRPSWSTAPRNWYNAEQAVITIPGIGLPAWWMICAFMVVYIIVVGPLNWMVLRVIKRRGLAWVTIPVLVMLFTAGAYVIGANQRGNRPVVHQLAVVEAWEGQPVALVNGLAGLFSPQRTRYDLAMPGSVLAGSFPEDGYYGNAGTLAGSGATLLQGGETRIEDLRLDVAEVRTFAYDSQIDAPVFESALTMTVSNQTAVLAGTVTNNSDLTLRDAVLLTPGGYQALGDFAPGAVVNVSLGLGSSRATPVSSSGVVVPAPIGGGGAGSPVVPISPGYYYNYDTTVDEILGYAAYYDNSELFRRYSMLTWLMDPYNGGSRGRQTYLVGWVAESPLEIAVDGRQYNREVETLYLVALDTVVQNMAAQLVVPPGLMTWQLLDPGTVGSGSPYDSYIYQGYFALRFRPQVGLVSNQQASALTLHLYSYGATGQANVKVSLYDVRQQVWVELQSPIWGDNLVVTPERFVGPDGSIDVRVEALNTLGSSVSLERLDFTVVMEQ